MQIFLFQIMFKCFLILKKKKSKNHYQLGEVVWSLLFVNTKGLTI